MKKLLVIAAVTLSAVCFSQTKSIPKFKLSDTVGHTGTFWILKDGYLVGETPADSIRDSLKCEFIQTETLKKLNKIRKDAGMKELVVDIRLKPAATHNAKYNLYCFKNKVFQPGYEWYQKGKITMTHSQFVDIPNFEELKEPWDRIKLLEPGVFSSITEELQTGFYLPWDTFDFITSDILNGYKACDAHWTALTKNPKWDCVYFYHDRVNAYCYIILGSYSKKL